MKSQAAFETAALSVEEWLAEEIDYTTLSDATLTKWSQKKPEMKNQDVAILGTDGPDKIRNLRHLLTSQRTAREAHAQTPAAQNLRILRTRFRGHLKNIGTAGNLEEILGSERVILIMDRYYCANQKTAVSSAENALAGIHSAGRMLDRVRDRALYKKVVDAYFTLPKNRISGLPLDEARQHFRSHRLRLLNLLRTYLDRWQVMMIDERRRNLRIAEKLYIELQRNALGVREDKIGSRGKRA